MDYNEDKPWLDPKWKEGKIRLDTKSVWWLFLIAVVFIPIPVPVFHGIKTAVAGGNYWPLLVFAFPFFGLIILALAVYYYRVYKRFRGSTFKLGRMPGVIGGELSGNLIIRGNFPLDEGLTIRLINQKTEVTHKEVGKTDTTMTTVVYDDTFNVNPGEIRQTRSGIDIPVKFSIPYDTFDPRDSSERTTYKWFLCAEKALEGPNLDLQFEIPVFRTEESNPQLTRVEVQSGARPEDISIPPGKRRIWIDLARGYPIYKASAWPGFGVIFGFMIFYSVIFGAMGVVIYRIIHGEWLLILALPIILFLLLLATAILYSLSGSKEIWFENNQLHRRHNLLGHKSRMSIPCRSILGFKLNIGGSAGTRDLYRVQISYQIENEKGGKPFKKNFDLVNLIPSREEARWFTALLSKGAKEYK